MANSNTIAAPVGSSHLMLILIMRCPAGRYAPSFKSH
jgi:hypothetical protein